MPKEDWYMTPFSTYDPQGGTRARQRHTTDRAWTRRREKDRVRLGSMMAKIGVCVGLLAAVLLVQVFILKQDAAGVKQVSTDAAHESGAAEEEDVLGRLRFVESGAVKSVFAVSQRWQLPMRGTIADLQQEDTRLCLTALSGDVVSCCAAGEVRATGRDATLGDYVRVNHGNDLESVYYHLTDICVEEGQPLMAHDTLGLVAGDGKLYVDILLSGAPQNPGDYLDIEA